MLPTDAQTDTDECFTPAAVVGVSDMFSIIYCMIYGVDVLRLAVEWVACGNG